jgi:hypothetical protein
MNYKKWAVKYLPYVLIVYSIFGIYKAVLYANELKDYNLPKKESYTESEKHNMTEMELEFMILKKYKYNYIELVIKRCKFYILFLGGTGVISLFGGVYLLSKNELKNKGHSV